ncbi:hypothetical protein LJB82_02915 [Desulfovibrio sp. OttesenSCG-928-M16]|nr:hypothetical protein [Desulfovibrio sp. OttesenSCG-928-M16]
MKNLYCAILVCCLALFSADPALAELEITFVNRTDFEIQAIAIQGDGGGMSSTIRVVPGNFCVFTNGNSSELQEVKIDVGLMLFTFTDMAALAGNAAPTLELSFDADAQPHLTLADNPEQADFIGQTTVFADPALESETDFTVITNAETMGEIRAMGAQTAPMWSAQVYLPATFAGKTWAVFVEPEETFASDDAAKPGACILRTYVGDGLAPLLEGLASAGYRPWFAQLTEGDDMDTTEMVRFWQEDLDAQGAWEQVADAGANINQGGKPAAIDLILLTDEGYARAEEGDDAALPGFRLRISNANVIAMQYMSDISHLISMTR